MPVSFKTHYKSPIGLIEITGTDDSLTSLYFIDDDFGETKSYLWQSKMVGDQLVVRAVASANGQNKIPIIIPCHRVIASDGGLTGYAGGL